MLDSRMVRLRELSRGAAPRIDQPKGIALPLYPHQVAAAEYASLAPRMILSDRPGTGKDYCAIAALSQVAEGRLLVASPPALMGLWEERLRQALPDRRLVTFTHGTELRRSEIAAGEIVLLRHRQMARAVELLRLDLFEGLIFDQCQMLACRWSRLATTTRRFIESLDSNAPVVASSSKAAGEPRILASVVEVVGRLDRHPRLAAIRHHRSWDRVPDALGILEELRGDCFLARDVETVLAMASCSGVPVAGCA